MAKTIILVHGRSWKPGKAELEKLWLEALAHGIARDFPNKMSAWEAATKRFVYYGDLSNRFLRENTKETYNAKEDIKDRRATLSRLKLYDTGEFTKSRYNKLPGKTAIKEAFADVFGNIMPFLRLNQRLISVIAPDMAEYWNDETEYGTLVRLPMIEPLQTALAKGDSVCVVAHSLGTMIAYDTFWKFSRYGEYREFWKKNIDLFVSLGSPLGDRTVQSTLKGARSTGKRHYPGNIKRWVNIAAEDDFICHDQKVKNDFRAMAKLGLTQEIRDERIYNLAVRGGKSNPHHGAGYLVDPKTAAAVAGWL